MGYICNDTILIDAVGGEKVNAALEAFRQAMPEEWRHLMVGPTRSIINAADYWVLHADGSKEGWPTSDEGDAIRAALVDLLTGELETWCYWVHVAWGHDQQHEYGATVEDAG